jgi:hypothetical protein
MSVNAAYHDSSQTAVYHILAQHLNQANRMTSTAKTYSHNITDECTHLGSDQDVK